MARSNRTRYEPRKIRDLAGGGYTPTSVPNRYLEFKNLLMNSFKISDVNYVEEILIKNQLIESGKVGYDKLLNKWAQCDAQKDLNEYGNPVAGKFIYKNGANYTRNLSYEPSDEGAYLINALPDTYALSSLIKTTTDFMQECDKAILQNVKACKSPILVVCKDADMQLSIQHAIQEQQQGQPVLIVSNDIGEAIKGVDLGNNYLADKFAELRDLERDQLFNKLGIMTSNINKRERVQVGEVNATIGQCVDYSYALIDTFNRQCETYGLPFRMSFNGSLEDLYANNLDNDALASENEAEYD